MPFMPSSRSRAVLIVSDDATFVGRTLERWSEHDDAPALRVVRSENCAACQADDFQLILLGGMRPEVCAEVLATFRPGNTPLIVIGNAGGGLEAAERNSLKVLVLPSLPDWDQLLVALAAEVGRRSEARTRALRIERANAAMQCEATLGRYMIEARHNLNNALTSVLGNAELLLLDEQKFSPSERKQIETIRVMALRLHETMQRFSSLEIELRATAGQTADAEAFQLQKEQERIPNQDSRVMVTEEDRPQLARAAGAD